MKNVAVFLFDISGIMAQPWLEAGYECWIVDIQHPPAYETGGVTVDGNLHKLHADLTRPLLLPVCRNRIAFAFAFPPCDHLAVSGARWFKGKGLRRLSQSIEMFATAAEKRLAAGVSVEPVGSVIEHVGVTDGVVEFTTPTCGPLPIGTNLVTLDQLTAAIAAARVAENERCLALMDSIGCDWRDAGDMAKFYAANYLREAIRALLGKEAQS